MFFSIKLQKFFPSNSNPIFRLEEQIPRIPSVFRDRGKSLALLTRLLMQPCQGSNLGKKIHKTTGLVAQNLYWTGTFFTRPKSYEKKKTKTQQKRILQ